MQHVAARRAIAARDIDNARNKACQISMISVVIPTLDAERGLPATLSALVEAAVDGLVREVIVADGGSRDATQRIAEEMGATVISSPSGRGAQLAAGARVARMPWLLFLHGDTALEQGWEREASDFMRRAEEGRGGARAASFRFSLDDSGLAPRLIESAVHIRSTLLGLPYGDQGLLLSRRLYDEVGGFRDLPIMEDVEFVSRIGRRRLVTLRSRALTSAQRYRNDGYFGRVMRNQTCLALYALGVSPVRIARLYESRQPANPARSREITSA